MYGKSSFDDERMEDSLTGILFVIYHTEKNISYFLLFLGEMLL